MDVRLAGLLGPHFPGSFPPVRLKYVVYRLNSE